MLRLIAAILLVASGSLGVAYLRGGAVPDKVRMPDFDLRELPMELGRWKGEEVELDRRLFQALDAAVVVDRVYRDESNHQILMHSVVFDSAAFLDGDATPHAPTQCYSAAGFEIREQKAVTIDVDQEEDLSAALLTMAREGTVLHVLVWYQLGERTFATWTDGKAARRSLWGQPVWPAMIKVMLQVDEFDTHAAEMQTAELAKEICRWMNHSREVAGAASLR